MQGKKKKPSEMQMGNVIEKTADLQVQLPTSREIIKKIINLKVT